MLCIQSLSLIKEKQLNSLIIYKINKDLNKIIIVNVSRIHETKTIIEMGICPGAIYFGSQNRLAMY